MFLIFSIVCFGYSIPLLFFKDIAWKIQEFENDTSGRESKRTEQWTIYTTIRGIIAILSSIGLMIIAFKFGF